MTDLVAQSRQHFEALGFQYPLLPKGWKDTSWHNDAMPSYEVGLFRIHIDKNYPFDREDCRDKRFHVHLCPWYPDHGLQVNEHMRTVFATESWSQVLDFINARPALRDFKEGGLES